MVMEHHTNEGNNSLDTKYEVPIQYVQNTGYVHPKKYRVVSLNNNNYLCLSYTPLYSDEVKNT